MKKLTAAGSSIVLFLTSVNMAFAQGTGDNVSPIIDINRPRLNGNPVGYASLSEFIRNVLTLIFFIALLLVLAMLIWGAIDWILAGNEKDGVKNARTKIINALVGLAVLAVAFAIFVLAGQFLGFNPTDPFTIPRPSE